MSLDEDASVAHAIPDAQADFRPMSPLTAMGAHHAGACLGAVRNELQADGRLEFFDQIKPWLTGDSAHGDQAGVAEPVA